MAAILETTARPRLCCTVDLIEDNLGWIGVGVVDFSSARLLLGKMCRKHLLASGWINGFRFRYSQPNPDKSGYSM